MKLILTAVALAALGLMIEAGCMAYDLNLSPRVKGPGPYLPYVLVPLALSLVLFLVGVIQELTR